MKRPDSNFARYLNAPHEASAWGLTLRAGGNCTHQAGESYPPAGHPADHAFGWKHGRVLGAWQIVFIASGQGEFDDLGHEHSAQSVAANDILLIVPGQWHRYRPCADTGWQEYWVELDGTVLQQLTETGILQNRGGILRVPQPERVSELIHTLLGFLKSPEHEKNSVSEYAALGLKLLGAITAKAAQVITPFERAVRRAEHVLGERIVQPPSMPALARELGVSYAGFRREFKRRTGLAPRQYLLRLRLDRAQRLIGATPLTLEAVAEQVGFSSAFHLSAAFKARFGIAPAGWRRGHTRAN
jgi:AraC-like DNA-binding protein